MVLCEFGVYGHSTRIGCGGQSLGCKGRPTKGALCPHYPLVAFGNRNGQCSIPFVVSLI